MRGGRARVCVLGGGGEVSLVGRCAHPGRRAPLRRAQHLPCGPTCWWHTSHHAPEGTRTPWCRATGLGHPCAGGSQRAMTGAARWPCNWHRIQVSTQARMCAASVAQCPPPGKEMMRTTASRCHSPGADQGQSGTHPLPARRTKRATQYSGHGIPCVSGPAMRCVCAAPQAHDPVGWRRTGQRAALPGPRATHL